MKIPFFNYPSLFNQRKEEYLEVITDALDRGAFIMQKDLIEFEERLSSLLGVKYAIGMADGTMSLIIALRASGVGNDDEVILPSHTFAASAASIVHVGAKPLLVDCGKDHLIDPQSIQKAITDKTKAIMPVQLNGRTADMDSIQRIAKKNNIIIVEDSCQALGSKFNNQFAGTFGAAGTFSFFPAKTLGCFGDGGAIVTNSQKIAEKVRLLRDHGRDENDGKVKSFGYNSRLDNVQAAVLNLKLNYYTEDINRRRAIAKIYDEMLKGLDSLDLPPGPSSNEKNYDIYQNYEIEADDRDGLQNFLDSKGIGTIRQWGGYALHQFEDLNLKLDGPNYTDEMTKRFLLLPMHPLLTDDEVKYICDQIIKFY
tara:strand:- start:4099 stop:5202 length:1104 start_codon:yes stop_codon:yes gene_type:complete